MTIYLLIATITCVLSFLIILSAYEPSLAEVIADFGICFVWSVLWPVVLPVGVLAIWLIMRACGRAQ
jgi:hypothetical protein